MRCNSPGTLLFLNCVNGTGSFSRICTIVCALLVLAGAVTASAQTFNGGLRGEVKDANGVIPGVTVTLTNEATGVAREVTTNEVGQYNFPAVQPGTYTIKAALTGFKAYESTGIRIGTQLVVKMSHDRVIARLAQEAHQAQTIRSPGDAHNHRTLRTLRLEPLLGSRK